MLRNNRVLIDLDALRNNYRLLKEFIPPHVNVMCVIKADAYGHGMLQAAQVFSMEGARHFAVAIAEEGVALRKNGIEGEILVLGASTPRAASEAIRYALSQTVFTPDMVRFLEKEAIHQQREALVHIKLDTGMNRIGLRTCEEACALTQALRECPHVKPVGIYTHLASADEQDATGALNAYAEKQLERFRTLRAYFPPSLPAHTANSALALQKNEKDFSMVRAGILLYGYPPVPTTLAFSPVMSWHTEVVHVKTLRAGEAIGYGGTYITTRETRVATVAVGYGDGYHRACSNGGAMLIHGKRAPILGRICMDQTMVDVTDIPNTKAGDDVVLLGRQGEETINAEDLANWAGTISYEVLLSIAPRVPRLYTGR